MKVFVGYSDECPSRPGGQTTFCTAPRNELHVFEDENEAHGFVKKVEARNAGRSCPKILGFWTEGFSNIILHGKDDE